MRFAVKFLVALWRGYWPDSDETGERLATAAELERYGLS